MARSPASTGFSIEQGPLKRWLPYLLLGALLLGAGWFVYTQVTGAHGVRVEAPPSVVAELLPPPPPPPPPPDTPPPEPEPQPIDESIPQPVEQPAPAPDAPSPVTINGPAQAGTDSYGLASGSGTGSGAPSSRGTCIGPNCGARPAAAPAAGGVSEAFYRRYLSTTLQRRIQDDNNLNREVFTADFAITISGGRVTQATLLRSSGRDERDEALRNALLTVTRLDPPPANLRFPQRITVRGRRSL